MKIFYTNRSEKILQQRKTSGLKFPACLTAFILLTGLVLPGVSMGRTLDRIIAVVNGEALTYSELSRAVSQARIGLLGFSPEETEMEGELFERNVLSRLIDQTIQLQMARRAGISVKAREVDMALEDVKKSNRLTTNDQLKLVLMEEGLTLEEYRESLREQISIIKLMNREVRSGVVLGQREIKNYYEDHKNKFKLSESYHLRQILFPPDSYEDPAVTAAEAHSKLDSGTPFDEVVKDYSKGPNAASGGDLGSIEKDLLQPQVRKAVENLNPGEFSETIKTTAGYHIFLLEGYSGSEPAPFDTVKDQVRNLLYRERTQTLYEAWLKNIRAISQVEVKYK